MSEYKHWKGLPDCVRKAWTNAMRSGKYTWLDGPGDYRHPRNCALGILRDLTDDGSRVYTSCMQREFMRRGWATLREVEDVFVRNDRAGNFSEVLKYVEQKENWFE